MNAVSALRVCIIDMNNGVANQAIRCFHRIIDAFAAQASARNPGIEVTRAHVQPRNLDEVPPVDCDLYLSSGGPGSPYDGYEDRWCTNYRRFLDRVVEEATATSEDGARAVFAVCHSFELSVQHFGIAQMLARKERKFGVMPVYPTDDGQRSDLLAPFGDRLFAWEHRSWEAVNLDEKRLANLGGKLLARESRDGQSKGEGLVAFQFAPGVKGTLFHPEADRAGAMAWLLKPEQAKAVVEAYGDVTYQRMLKTLDNPMRLARTFSLLVPGWLVRRFNALAPYRGWVPIDPPVHDHTTSLAAFAAAPGSP